MNSNEVGKELEESVRAIAAVILAGSEVGSRVFKVIPNHIVYPGGVKTEIDAYVEEVGVPDKLYLFECKNQTATVGKNDIIIFADKIAALNAMKGYFVAPKYSRFAKMRAAQTPKMELLLSSNHKITNGSLQFPVALSVNEAQLDPICLIGMLGPHGPITAKPDSLVESGGRKTTVQGFFHGVAHLCSQSIAPETSGQVQEFVVEDSFPDGLVTIDGVSILRYRLQVTATYKIHTPAILYGYDIHTKGTYVKYERFPIAPGQFADGLAFGFIPPKEP